MAKEKKATWLDKAKSAYKRSAAKQKAASEARLTPKQRAHKAKGKKARVEKQKTKNVEKKAKRLEKAYHAESPVGTEGGTAEGYAKRAKEKAKAPETGRVRKGAKGVTGTKGGAYIKYGKKSKAAKSFRSEFAAARKSGKKAFTWDGRSYSTARADDKKKAAPKKVAKKAAPKKVAPKKDMVITSPIQQPSREEYKQGGKVESSGGESNPYGWPSSDSRKR